MAVLRAWERKDFDAVIDICDDVIEADGYDYERWTSSLLSTPPSMLKVNPEDQKRHTRAELYIFHRNVKAAALNYRKKFSDALRVADETVRLTKSRDRDSLCLRGTALNALGTIENNRVRDEQALKSFTDALALLRHSDHDLETSLNQASLYLKLGRTTEALEAAQTALDYLTVIDTSDSSYPALSGVQTLNNMFDDDPFAERLGDEDRIGALDGKTGNKNGALANSDSSRSTADEDWVDPNGDNSSPRVYRQLGLDREHVKFDPDLHILICAIHMNLRRFEMVITQAQLGLKAIKRKGALGSPILSRMLDMQMKAYMALNRNAEAEVVAKMLAKMHPYDLDHLDPLIQLMLSLNRPFEQTWALLRSYEPHVSHDMHLYPRLLKVMLACLSQAQKLEETIGVCDKLFKLGAELDVAYSLKGITLLKLSRSKETLALCEEAERAGHLLPELVLARAMSLDALGQFEDASLEFERAVTKFPEYAPAHLRYADSLARRGRNNEALIGFDRAIAISTKQQNGAPPIQMLLSKANFLRTIGRLKDALEIYTYAARFDPNIAKQLPVIAQEFQQGNPREFMSKEQVEKAEKIRQRIGETIGLDNIASAGSAFRPK